MSDIWALLDPLNRPLAQRQSYYETLCQKADYKDNPYLQGVLDSLAGNLLDEHHWPNPGLLQHINQQVLEAFNDYRHSLPQPLPRPVNVKTEIWHHRYLWVTHTEKINQRQRVCSHENHRCFGKGEADLLKDLCAEHPKLHTIRTFIEDIWDLFGDTYTHFQQVKERYETLCQKPDYQNNLHLQRALDVLAGDTLEKDYVNLPRTNNQAEIKARRFRKRHKGHYKLRRTHTLTRAMKADLIHQKAKKQARGDPVVRLQRKADEKDRQPAKAA